MASANGTEYGASVLPFTRLRVYLRARDVDGLPINFTRAAVEFRFGDVRRPAAGYVVLPVLLPTPESPLVTLVPHSAP